MQADTLPRPTRSLYFLTDAVSTLFPEQRIDPVAPNVLDCSCGIGAERTLSSCHARDVIREGWLFILLQEVESEERRGAVAKDALSG